MSMYASWDPSLTLTIAVSLSLERLPIFTQPFSVNFGASVLGAATLQSSSPSQVSEGILDLETVWVCVYPR